MARKVKIPKLKIKQVSPTLAKRKRAKRRIVKASRKANRA